MRRIVKVLRELNGCATYYTLTVELRISKPRMKITFHRLMSAITKLVDIGKLTAKANRRMGPRFTEYKLIGGVL